MTARGVVLPLAIVAALGLAACAEHNTPTAAAPEPAPTESASTEPKVRTASADDPEADAREEGFESAAEQARARAYGEAPTDEQPPEQR